MGSVESELFEYDHKARKDRRCLSSQKCPRSFFVIKSIAFSGAGSFLAVTRITGFFVLFKELYSN